MRVSRALNTRPNWRDPAMPCLELSCSRGTIEVTAEFKAALARKGDDPVLDG